MPDPGTRREVRRPDGTTLALRWMPGGRFRMGSVDFYPEEAPVHEREVPGLWVAESPVTVAEFAAFVAATGHVTTAERPPDPALYPDVAPEDRVPASIVFTPPDHPVPLDDPARWWSWVPGATWRSPEGPGSDVAGREDHPVTQVSHEDATAYAVWAGLALPTEVEWEHAARGGLDGATYAWGDEPFPGGRFQANTWHGEFPWQNTVADGYARTSPVGSFPANGYGLYDATGNVWEWTDSDWTADHADHADPAHTANAATETEADHACCGGSAGPRSAGPRAVVIKGGSHLCAPSYCLRYRPAARQLQTTDSSTSHLGFRCVLREG